MICKKCENRVNTGTKCFQCGHDNNNALTPAEAAPAKYKRSPVLIAVMSLFIFLAFISILANIGGILRIMPLANLTLILPMLTGISNTFFFVTLPGVSNSIVIVTMTIAAAVFEIALCICILKLEKRAFKVYGGLIIALGVLKLISLINLFLIVGIMFFFSSLLPYFLKGLLLFVVYKLDGKHFGGTSFDIDQPVSVILARRRQEREEKEKRFLSSRRGEFL